MAQPGDSMVPRRGPLVPGTVIDGRYRITGLIGNWHIGTAYRASGGQGPCTLVICDVVKGRAATFRDWAREEVERSRASCGPTLVTLRDAGLHGESTLFLALRPWEGRSLLGEIKENGAMSNERACRIGEALSKIVARAHSNRLTLAGLRPSTVLLAPTTEAVIVLDLGMGRGLADYLEHAPSMAAAYASPERLLSLPIGPADDIYATGALIYYLLTGQAPAAGRPGEAKLVTPPSWTRKDEGIARYIDSVVLKAMARLPSDRHTANELVLAMGALREVFQISSAAREVLGLPNDGTPFRHEPTSPFFLHDLLGIDTTDAVAPRKSPKD
ncbi:MAG: hypothetical protein EXR76_11845 [Myxococcales bacterium]|nr:hypothetical protein [Myxococcales bacterium]